MSKGKTVKTKKNNRTPIVTFLGHVDHGKTTILDNIRKTAVQEHEVGGITQGISIYSVSHDGKDITFIDTPGHEAFDLMRSRGGSVADIVLLIVAADDGIKPQTKESIEIIKAGKANPIVILNKVDIKGVKLEKIKRELSVEGIVVEDMGGDVPCVEVSGKTGAGIDDLLNMINLVVEVSGINENKLSAGVSGSGIILESYKDDSKGNVSTIVVLSGEFKKGSLICYSGDNDVCSDKIKGFLDESDGTMESIKEGYGGRILGISEILSAGDQIYCVEDGNAKPSGLFCEKEEPSAPEASTSQGEKESDEPETSMSQGEEDIGSTADLAALLAGSDGDEGDDIDPLNVVVKTCSQGALDAVLKSIEKINSEDRIVKVINSGVGNVTISDIEYAKDSKGLIAGFSVAIDKGARDLARKEGVIVRTYKLIYELLEEMEDAAVALQLPDEEEKVVGTGKVKQIFELSDGGIVIGTRVESGEIRNGLKCRVLRGEDIVVEAKINSMRCGKDKTDKVGTDVECGIILSVKGDVKEGDLVECYRIVKT